MKITRKSILSGITRTLEIDISEEQLTQFNKGKHIQWVCPQLSPDDREFIMSGITTDEWDRTFNKEENDNGNTTY